MSVHPLKPKVAPPVRRELWSESSDPHLCGPLIVELSEEGVRWWWSDGENEAPADAMRLTPAMLAEGGFVQDVNALRDDVRLATDYLESAKRRVLALDRIRSFKVID